MPYEEEDLAYGELPQELNELTKRIIGAAYEVYEEHVPRWIPRTSPWSTGTSDNRRGR